MSYFLQDANGNYLGDFASTMGLGKLRKIAPNALRKFIQAGRADNELCEQIINETVNVDTLSYIGQMIKNATPPIVLSDGVT